MMEQEQENEADEFENSFDAAYENILHQVAQKRESLYIYKDESDQHKQVLQEKIKVNEDLMKENINLKQEILYEVECQENVAKLFLETHSVLQSFLEKKTAVANLVEIYETDVTRSEELNQQIIKDFEKMVAINKEKLKKKADEKIKLNQKLQEGKKRNSELLAHFADVKKHAANEINCKEDAIKTLQKKYNDYKKEEELIQNQTMDVSSENREIVNKIEEIKLAYDNFLQEKDQKTIELEEKMARLKDVAQHLEIDLNNIATEQESSKDEIGNKQELLNQKKIHYEELENKMSQNNITKCALNEEIEKIKETHEKEVEDSKIIIGNIKLQIEEINKKMFIKEEENKQLEMDNFSLNTKVNTITDNITRKKLSYVSLQQEENNLKEGQKIEDNKLEEMVNTLKMSLETENKRSLELTIKEKLLRNDVAQADEMLAAYTNQYEKLCEEATGKEVEINCYIDGLNHSKNTLQNKLQESVKNLEDVKAFSEEMLKKEEENHERELQKLIEHQNFFKNETERVQKINEQQRKEKICKIKRTNNTLQLKILEMQTERENIRRVLDQSVKELNDMRAKVDDVRKSKIESPSKIFTFKKPICDEAAALPEMKVPPSRYSSSSFSDSSFSSVENDSRLMKRREFLNKQRTKAKKNDTNKSIQKSFISSSQKELDELFDSLKG